MCVCVCVSARQASVPRSMPQFKGTVCGFSPPACHYFPLFEFLVGRIRECRAEWGQQGPHYRTPYVISAAA